MHTAAIAGVKTTWGKRQMAEDYVPPARILQYSAEWKNGVQKIGYTLPYLDLFRNGGPIHGYNALEATFKWRFPEIAVNVVNNTDSTMVLSQAILTIENSAIDRTPLLLVEDYSVNNLAIRNEGWADISGGEAEFEIRNPAADGEVAMFAPVARKVSIPAFTELVRIAVPPLLPDRMKGNGHVTLSGKISYQVNGKRASVAFETNVLLQVRPGAGIPASHSYRGFFRAGKSQVRIPIDIAQQIPAKGADRFYIQLASDKSSRTRARIDFAIVGGGTLPGGEFQLDMFVPRSAGL